MKTEDGRLIVVGGASRSGKTAYVRKRTAGEDRIIAYDPEDQWAQLRGWRRVTTRAELLDCARQRGPMKIAYVAGGNLAAEFDFWAGCVMYAGRYLGPLVCIGEELADVTTSGKAPGNWGILIRRGLKRGITIFAISQRWQEADKTAFDNASEYVFFRQANPKARAYVAERTGIPWDQIPEKPLLFVRKDTAGNEIETGKLRF